MKEYSGNLELFGGFPGGRNIAAEEEKLIREVIMARSPYRYYGLDPRGFCTVLEKKISALTGLSYSLCLSSGTAALHTALHAGGIKPGDEVIIPAYAWSADLMAVLAVGAVPVIAPIDETLGLDPSSVRGLCSAKTKAIIAVHMRGQPCAINEIQKQANKLQLTLIEDCAQSLGGVVSGRPVGSFGDISIFSFQFNKLLTSGEGGALITSDPGIYERARRFHDLGMLREIGQADPSGEDAIGSFGLNYRMTELQAAMLIGQLGKMPLVVKMLENTYKLVDEEFSELWSKCRLTARPAPPYCQKNFAFYGLQSMEESSVRETVSSLRAKGLPAQWCGSHDPHHFCSWVEFMVRGKYSYRIMDSERSANMLNKNLFFEINASPRKQANTSEDIKG